MARECVIAGIAAITSKRPRAMNSRARTTRERQNGGLISGGVLRDERWLKPVEDVYRRLAEWEKYLRNLQPLARVGIVYSQQTAWFVGNRIEDHIHGWYQALIEARIPFELVHDRLLDAEH